MLTLATDHLPPNPPHPHTPTSPSTLAFLQFTSGSTGTPKGVMVSHRNLIYNSKIIYTCFESSPDHIGVSWLPFHHDMGLIGGVLQPIYGGGTVVLLSPVAFLQKPIRWLQTISHYRAVTSGGPNFAYDLCAQTAKPEQLAALDLSSWDLAFTGAEPIRPETLEQFSTTFAASRFKANAFYPCYGMAETTLLVTGGNRASDSVVLSIDRSALERGQVVEKSPSPESKRVVGCGHTWLDYDVKIVDPDSLRVCEPSQIGEIWVKGESVAQGYWEKPAQTEQTFQACTADTEAGPFLRTGDLGFLKGEDLFITGRLKDVIIIRGRNHYPQDIELTVETAHDALQANGCAAFSAEVASEEQLIVVQEVKRAYLRQLETEAEEDPLSEKIIWAIRRAISAEHELQVHAIHLIKPGSLPKTSSGKVQRKKCRLQLLDGHLAAAFQWERALLPKRLDVSVDENLSVDLSNLDIKEQIQAVETWLTHRIAQRLQLQPTDIARQEPLASYGLDSVQVVEISGELEAWLKRPVLPTIVYDFPTIEALSRQLVLDDGTTAAIPIKQSPSPQEDAHTPIAVVGIGCRFPGAPTVQAFWQLLRKGQDAITEVPLSRWDPSQIEEAASSEAEDAVRWGGFIKQIDQFDPKFFGISPREATHMDPQQRLLLEVCWETLENAGLATEQLAGSQSGIFLGVSNGDYSRLQGTQLNKDVYYGTGNAFSIIANRLSYLLDWHGPSCAMDTACSSSLVAVHQACQNLRLGECDLALAGGVNLILDPQLTVTFSQAQMLAADGRCKTFDASADGYVRSEGCGMVALKRLSAAQQDGDTILGIVQGSAVNQDGRSNGLTAPNSLAQQQVIRQAQANAGISDAQVDYIEAHGTGTSLGDPIEVNALKAVFQETREKGRPCWLGSVKTNIGHLEPAAGIAGLIKVLLSLKHKEIPPHLHLQKVNPYIQLETSPLRIPTECQPWPAEGKSRIAGVSSFGFGGTNAHVIVAEAPSSLSANLSNNLSAVKDDPRLQRPLHVLTLSAKSEDALSVLVAQYRDWLLANDELSVADICYTANAGRSHFSHRLAITTASTELLQQQLEAIAHTATLTTSTTGIITGHTPQQKPPEIAFLFTGQGSQYTNMGRQLYETQPIFRDAINRCADILSGMGLSLIGLLYPDLLAETSTSESVSQASLNQTANTQPALFSIEYALALLWQSWGIVPDVVLGHSVGEYAAACIAGVFSLEDGLKLIAERGRLMQALPTGGKMLSILATPEQVEAWIAPYEGKVSIATINGPSSLVISGEGEAVSAIAASLTGQNIKNKFLAVSHAFHSPLMEPMVRDFEAIAKSITYSVPAIPFVSCLTGQLIHQEIATPDYWVQHIKQPVRFADGIATLHQKSYSLYVEIGPKPILLGMAKQCLPAETSHSWLPSLRPVANKPAAQQTNQPANQPAAQHQNDWQHILQTLTYLYISGVKIDWAGFDRPYPRQKVVLPTYPFQRQRYWVSPPAPPGVPRFPHLHPLIGQKLLSPIPPTQFQTQLSVQQPAYLTHHRVFAQAIFPATAYLEIALAAGHSVLSATQISQTASLTLTEVIIQRGLILPEDSPLTVQTVLTPEENNVYTFKIFSLETETTAEGPPSQEKWRCHAQGKVQTVESTLPAPVDLETCRANFLQQIPAESYYARLHKRGLEYGEDFQAIQQLWAAPYQALGEISLPATVVEKSDRYQLHPVLLDASFQVLAAAIGESAHQDIYLPAGIDRLQLYGPVSQKLWAVGTIRKTVEAQARQLTADVKLLSPTGALIAQINGLKLNCTSRDLLMRVLQPEKPPALYKLGWVRSPLTPSSEPNPLIQPASKIWIILHSENSISQQLIEQLHQQDGQCVLVSPSTHYQQIDEQQYRIDPTNPEDFYQFVQSVLAQYSSIHGVVHLWGTDSSTSDSLQDLEDAQALGSAALLHLVQALIKARSKPALTLITQGAQSLDHESPLCVQQSSLWGFGRVISLEHPELKCRRIDLPATPEGNLAPQLIKELVKELSSPDQEDQIAYRQERYVARLAAYETASSSRLTIPNGQSFRLQLSEYGLIDNLALQALKRRSPTPHEVEIQVAAAGLNFRDVLNVLGLLKDYYAEHLGITEASQLTFGFECAGTVVAVGEAVSHLQIGDDVIATMLTDGVSRFVTTRAEFVIPKPTQLSFAESATLPLAFLTAYYGLQHLANLQPGDRVLIHAAAGGVGQAAVQVAKQAGAEIFATASPSKWDFLKGQGIAHVMNSRTLDFADQIMQITAGQGVDVVLNSLNGDFIDASFAALSCAGRFVELGKIGIWDAEKVQQTYPDVAYYPFDLGEVTKADPSLIHQLWQTLSEHFDNSYFHALPIKTFPIEESPQAFRHMQQAKHIGKVVLTFPKLNASGQNIASPVGSRGTYLITGGLGALGLQVARWLVTQGGKHLILTGRRAPSAQAQAEIRSLEALGAHISVALGDISQPSDVASIIAQCTVDNLPEDNTQENNPPASAIDNLPPLKGIIHAAGILEDGLLSQLSWEQFSRVMSPKVQGTWNLHRATQTLPLDFFVCFSSMASLIGSPGQANYSAANAFMDALMQHRRAMGLPGLSINWGPWANAGMAAQLNPSAQDRLRARGITPLKSKESFQALEYLLTQPTAQAGYFSIDWSKFTAQLPPSVSLPVLEHIVEQFVSDLSDTAKGASLQGLEQLKKIPLADRRRHLIRHIQSEIADVLGYSSPDEIALDQPLADLGVDSLMAVELANQLEHTLGPTIPASFLFEHPTLEGLVAYLTEQMPSVMSAQDSPGSK
ncbi:MAG: SDR family NAD(P)-dependent oxidoreductase [Cyanobacteria bacterium J06631_12]